MRHKPLASQIYNVISPSRKPVTKVATVKPSVSRNENDYPSDSEGAEIDDILMTVQLSTKNHNDDYRTLAFSNAIEAEKLYVAAQGPKDFRKIKASNRSILVDWMIHACDEMRCLDETLFLSVSLFDRVAAINPIKKCHIQLFGSTCMWIASKMEETLIPAISDFMYLCGNAYVESEFIDCERVILRLLKFSVAATTPLFYLNAVLKNYADGASAISSWASFFCCSALLSENYGTMRPSVVAVTSMFLAYCVLNKTGSMLEYEVDIAEVAECAEQITTAVAAITAPGSSMFLLDRFSACLESTGLTMKEVGDSLLKNVNEANIVRFCLHK